MNARLRCIAVGLFIAARSMPAGAQIVIPVRAAVDHPLVLTLPVRTQALWRKGVEGFGESFVSQSLKLRGYEVHDSKIAGDRGIDLIAMKRNTAGKVTDVRLIEVKTHYGERSPRLGETKHGLQTSRTWFANRLEKLRLRGADGRSLALEISRFRKSGGVPIDQIGEVHDVNLRQMKYTIRNPVTLGERAGPLSISRELNEIAARIPECRPWALQHLAQSDQIGQARMSAWLTGDPASRAFDEVTVTRLISIEDKQALRGAGKAFAHAAGRLALVVAIAMDVHEIYGHIWHYDSGSISRAEFVVALSRSGGGIVGSWAGATGGAVAGAWVGAFGGPLAWATVPVCGLIGAVTGGVVGYVGGSYIGDAAAKAWYRSLDHTIKKRIDQWLKLAPTPFTRQARSTSDKVRTW